MIDSRQAWLQFLKDCPSRTYHRGEIIIFQGESPQYASVIKTGIVKAYNLSSTGDEKPVGFHGELSVLPAPWVFGVEPSSLYYYEAFSLTVDIYSISREKYINYLKASPELLYASLIEVLNDGTAKTMRLNALQHSWARDKLVYTLHYLAHGHGRAINNDEIEIQLDLTHQHFADLTGITRETAATVLNKLKQRKIINYGKGMRYRVNLKKLNSVLDDKFIAELDVKL